MQSYLIEQPMSGMFVDKDPLYKIVNLFSIKGEIFWAFNGSSTAKLLCGSGIIDLCKQNNWTIVGKVK